MSSSSKLAMKSKAARFRSMLSSPDLEFIMEAHNGLSAKIVEETGFKGIWASGLSISAALGVRDNNEASWTQVVDVLEFMSDATSIPIMLDGDTGYGNFNNMRRLVHKLCQRDIAAVCIEDKLFPKSNSLGSGDQSLADIDEFCGKIKAGKDSQTNENFSVVARVEALIAGWGLDEALRRAEAYRAAGADAILMHSKKSHPNEILAFMKEWANRGPVVIVPTTYYSTPTERFSEAGVSLVIWANHNLRAAMTAMRATSKRIFEDQSLLDVEDQVASVKEIFASQGVDELEAAEKRYFPAGPGAPTKAVVLAASRGSSLERLTEDRPKCMLDIRGQPLLRRLLDTVNECGIQDVTVVRGYKKEAVDLIGIKTVDNDAFETTGELASLICARNDLDGDLVLAYGDILFRRYVLDTLLGHSADIVLAVDTRFQERIKASPHKVADLVRCSRPFRGDYLGEEERVLLADIGAENADGEWIGLAKFSPKGTERLRAELEAMAANDGLQRQRLPDLFSRLLQDASLEIDVAYITGHWLDVDDVFDLAEARSFS